MSDVFVDVIEAFPKYDLKLETDEGTQAAIKEMKRWRGSDG